MQKIIDPSKKNTDRIRIILLIPKIFSFLKKLQVNFFFNAPSKIRICDHILLRYQLEKETLFY